MVQLKPYFVEIGVSVCTWVQVYAKDEHDAAGLADAVASNLDVKFISQLIDAIDEGDYTCEPHETLLAEKDQPFSDNILTLKQIESDECQECGRPASECSFGGYEVIAPE
jgi:hypothetical protein